MANQPQATPAESRKICGLDLVRFAAALLVVLHHLGFWVTKVVPATSSTLGPLAPYTAGGWIGVEIFFVLSGFVIAYSAEKATWSSFAVSRALRLYPAAWICSLITATVLLCTHQAPSKHILFVSWLHAFTLWPFGIMLDTVYWTLRVEMVFYLCVFLLLLANSFRHLPKFIATLGLLSSAGWTYAAVLAGRVPASAPARHIAAFYATSDFRDPFLLRFSPFFAIGVFLWLCLLQRVTAGRVIVLLLCSVGAVLEIHSHAVWFGPQFSATAPIALWIISLLAIVASVKANAPLTSKLGPRGVAISRTLGLISYPLYLVHAEAGYTFIRILHPYVPDVVSTLLAILLVLTLSFLINRLGETPLQRHLRRLLPLSQPSQKRSLPLVSSLP